MSLTKEELVKDGKLCAVIDFGILGVGDPSCDAAIAWTFFDDASRKVCKNEMNLDEKTWNRARGWALWKALITYDVQKESDKVKAKEAFNPIQIIVEDYKKISSIKKCFFYWSRTEELNEINIFLI